MSQDDLDLSKRPLRWGICGAGNIAFDFVNALQSLPKDQHVVHAVGDMEPFKENAVKFAAEFEIPNVYSSFEALADDPLVDVAYVGVVNTMHFPVASLLLRKKKNVVLEKPLSCCSRLVEELIAMAKENDVFFMEAMWMHFFPSIKATKQMIADGKIGEVGFISAVAGFLPKEYLPRHTDPKLWGGSFMDMCCYLLHLVVSLLGYELPEKILATSTFHEMGTDESTAVTMQYANGTKVQLYTTMAHRPPSEAMIVGKHNYIRLNNPLWSTESIETRHERQEFPIPRENFKRKMKHPNSEGLVYEIEAIRECLVKGEKECPLSSHKQSLVVAQLQERILDIIGIKFEIGQK